VPCILGHPLNKDALAVKKVAVVPWMPLEMPAVGAPIFTQVDAGSVSDNFLDEFAHAAKKRKTGVDSSPVIGFVEDELHGAKNRKLAAVRGYDVPEESGPIDGVSVLDWLRSPKRRKTGEDPSQVVGCGQAESLERPARKFPAMSDHDPGKQLDRLKILLVDGYHTPKRLKSGADQVVACGQPDSLERTARKIPASSGTDLARVAVPPFVPQVDVGMLPLF
jgi:hypothetical protein